MDFIPGCFIETEAKGPAIHKYRSLLEKGNTPFSPIQASAAPSRRLWHFLVRQELVQDIFIRAIFGKKRTPSSAADGTSVAPSVAGDTAGGSGELRFTLKFNCLENSDQNIQFNSGRWSQQQSKSSQRTDFRASSHHSQRSRIDFGILLKSRESRLHIAGNATRSTRNGYIIVARLTQLDGRRMRVGYFEFEQRFGLDSVQQFLGHSGCIRQVSSIHILINC